MAWTAPMTFADGVALTADQLNEQLRDNLMETMPAKASRNGAYFVTDDTNHIAERLCDSARVNAIETTTSATYTDLATVGPSVTLETGNRVMVFNGARIQNGTADAASFMSWSISGATTRDPIADSGLLDLTAFIQDGTGANSGWYGGMVDIITAMNPGINTFTAKYRVGTAGNAGTFSNRFIAVFPF